QLSQILPKKKFIKRQLFDLDSRHTYRKIIPVYQLFYNSISNQNQNESPIKIPEYIDGSDLMIMKRILENYRILSNLIIKNLVNLENELLEAAAELHDNNAISILAFETLLDKNSNIDDKNSAKSLIKSLHNIDHPLTIKNLGDLAFNFKNYLNAEHYYLSYLDIISKSNPNKNLNKINLIFANTSITNTLAETYKQLGILNFQKPNLSLAKQYFTQSILTLNTYNSSNSNSIQSHYYLAQIYSRTNPKLSRYHLEISAQSAFKESFKDLGFLELNYFNNPIKALEWFKLGYDLNDSDINYLIGKFDCYILLNDYTEARSTYDSL
ncbi:Mss2p ASCRUDRAFT_26236, partial [Ascoidea rubescens DSM 1968]